MIKNTFFSYVRFQLLLKKYILENWKTLGLRLLLMYGVFIIGLTWNGYIEYSTTNSTDPTIRFTSFFFLWMLYIFAAISASFIMEEMKTKTNRISFLMTPATSFEKYIMKWFVCFILFFISFIFLFKLADYTKILIFTLAYPQNIGIETFNISSIIDINNNNAVINNYDQLNMPIAAFLFIQSAFILGGTIWPKNAFIKTFATGMILFLMYSFILTYSYKLLYPDFPDKISFVISNWYISLFLVIIAVFNWVIAYFRFKEAEIINRL